MLSGPTRTCLSREVVMLELLGVAMERLRRGPWPTARARAAGAGAADEAVDAPAPMASSNGLFTMANLLSVVLSPVSARERWATGVRRAVKGRCLQNPDDRSS
jgi:hypothetical protein